MNKIYICMYTCNLIEHVGTTYYILDCTCMYLLLKNVMTNDLNFACRNVVFIVYCSI